RRAILMGTTVGYVSVVCVYVWGDVVFAFLVNSYGAVALFVYLAIALSQVVLRKRLDREDPAALKLKMWLFPWLSYATIALMLSVIAAMALLPSTQTQFVMSGVTLVVILLSYELRRRYGRKPGEEAGNDAADLPADPSLDPSAEGLEEESDMQPVAARP
ncbi:hypothetical protein QK290_18095, partial [Pseudarthrobacter sp. AL07]|nr:hypothetical protein [Pseudarthrobacter sp. AL20]MDI3210368.1 hypothetical protein [Pseudarthrobacter sp. AL07]